MIPSARPLVPPVVIIIFMRLLLCDILKSGEGRTDGNLCENNNHMSFGSAEWINITTLSAFPTLVSEILACEIKSKSSISFQTF